MTETEMNRKHTMTWYGTCYYCICRVCNMDKCRYRTHFERCLYCVKMANKAVLDCDYFESRYVRKVYRIKKDLLNSKRPTVRDMITDIWKSGKWK